MAGGTALENASLPPWREGQGCVDARRLSERWIALAAWSRKEHEALLSQVTEAERIRSDAVAQCCEEVARTRREVERAEAARAAAEAEAFEERERSTLGLSRPEWLRPPTSKAKPFSFYAEEKNTPLLPEERLAAALASRSAQFIAYKTEAERRLESTHKKHEAQLALLLESNKNLQSQLRASVRAILDERRLRVAAESDLHAAQSTLTAKREEQSAEIDQIKIRLQSEAYAGRQALRAELEGATDRLRHQRDQALIQRDQAVNKFKATQQSYHENLVQADKHIAFLQSQLKREQSLRKTLAPPKIPVASTASTRTQTKQEQDPPRDEGKAAHPHSRVLRNNTDFINRSDGIKKKKVNTVIMKKGYAQRPYYVLPSSTTTKSTKTNKKIKKKTTSPLPTTYSSSQSP